jgi:hypothetical protein
MVSRGCAPITDGNGTVIGIACGTRRRCSTPGCSGCVELRCDYPITRRGQPATCDRYVCQRCAHSADGLDYCAAHGRSLQKETT